MAARGCFGNRKKAYNRKCLELTGGTRQNVLGTPSTIHWADSRDHEEMMRLLARDGRVTNFECRVVEASGKERSCLTSLSLHPGQKIIEGSLVDITERKNLEAEREAGLQRTEFIIAATRTGLDIIDENLVVQYIDPARMKILGDPDGRVCYDYFRGRSTPR